MSGTVRYEIADGVAHLVLDRPDAANAIDMDTALALGDAVDTAVADDAVRVLLLTGAGPRFCAGGDVAWMLGDDDRGARVEALATVLDGVLARLHSSAKPAVAAVQGAVAGAGLAVMLSCDVVVAAPTTKFVAAYAAVGLSPDCGVSWLLPRAVGQQRALEMLLAQRVLVADAALAWGGGAQIADDPGAAATELARRMAAGPAYALGQTRRLVRDSWVRDRVASGADETRTITRAVQTPEADRLLSRFLA